MRHSVQRSWSILRLGIIGPSIGHLTARCWRLWRLTPENKGAELTQKPTVVALGNGPSPTAQLGIDRLFHEFFDDAPAHIDVATILDELALEDPLELGVGKRCHQPFHPAEFKDLWPEIERGNPDRMRVGGEVSQRKD